MARPRAVERNRAAAIATAFIKFTHYTFLI
jgi:hypothetical protein